MEKNCLVYWYLHEKLYIHCMKYNAVAVCLGVEYKQEKRKAKKCKQYYSKQAKDKICEWFVK